MMNDVLRALFWPISTGDITLPEQGGTLLVNVDYGSELEPFLSGRLTHWGWRIGTGSMDPVSERSFSAVFVLLPQQRESALGLLAWAQSLLVDEGLLVVAAANDAGGRRLVDDLQPFCGDLNSACKHKCRVVWARKPAMRPFPADWVAGAAPRVHPDTGLWTQPGIFSWDRIDKATALLLPHIPKNETGVFIDAGCGNGVITRDILIGNPDATRVYGFDADARAVAMCRRNLESFSDVVDILWTDFVGHPKEVEADWVIMNPPFHDGKGESILLGQRFIVQAVTMLKPRGQMLMVANAHLPYEKTLRACFQNVEKVQENQGFKIFLAQR